ncbi:MAG: hypothetical protein WA110_02805, partial [Anaerolineaceae bacterium]
AFLLALFLIILGVGWLIRSLKSRSWRWNDLLALVLPAGVGLLLVSPWYLRVLKHSQGIFSTSISLPIGSEGFGSNPGQWNYLRSLLGPETGYILLVLACFGAIWALVKPAWRELGIWSLLVGFLALPLGIKIASFNSNHFGMVLFIAIASLGAAFIIWAVDWLAASFENGKLIKTVGAILVAALLVGGGWLNRNVINSNTVLANENDVEALTWIQAHTPAEARFYVNTTGWGYDIYRGVDGGAWILPYTGRWSLAPTIFYTFGGETETVDQWKNWGERAAGINGCTSEFWQLVDEADVDYLYLREGAGSLSASALQGCERLKQLYAGGGVSIWLVE